MHDFKTLGLNDRLLARLAENGLKEPTPIQNQAIPHGLNGRDIMGLAQTGTGKTLAFGLPIIQVLSGAGTKPDPKSARALILAPTRELAKQITDHLHNYTKGTHLKIVLVVGGASPNAQAEKLSRGADMVVATPGRLLDMVERKALTLSKTNMLVLDEADQMLDLGFIHALRRIASMLPKERQTMLFSATMPKNMTEIAAAYLQAPVRIEANPPGKAADRIDQSVHFVTQGEKPQLLVNMLDKHLDELALVFSRTKHGAERLLKTLEKAGYAAGSIHGNKSQGQRDRALAAFRAGDIRVLVATDVAARGIDIPEVRHVYNYDLPNVPDNYVHRIGRTARAGAAGRAVAFCTAEEFGDLKAIEKVMGQTITVAGGHVPVQAIVSNGPKGSKGPVASKGKPNWRDRKPQGQNRGRQSRAA
ncbi:MAG: DEAD/DEAH box helicase [Deltaproteobacteria bacterium]